jgi:hypothetical protein
MDYGPWTNFQFSIFNFQFSIVIRYRTFEQLLSDVAVDFPTIHQEGMIEPAQLVKVAQRVTYDLGLRVHQEKTAVVEVERKRGKLPDDFYVLNFAMVCTRFVVEEPVIHGTHTEEVLLCPLPENVDPCDCNPKPCLTQCGQHMVLKQSFKSETRVYDRFEPIKLRDGKEISPGCPNLSNRCLHEAHLRNGWVYANFDCGNIFISYMGALEDEVGNLLVPDHPFLNEYYEYAVKQRVLENMAFGGEPVGDKMGLIEQRLRAARNNALSVVNTPDFEEYRRVVEANRKYMVDRYYSMF